MDNLEKMETFRNCKVRLIRVFDAPPAEVELAVGLSNRTETQQVNLKVNASQTIDDYEILCEEIKVGGGKAGGSARILVRYKEPVEKAVVQTSPAEGSENRECEAAIPVLVPLVDLGTRCPDVVACGALSPDGSDLRPGQEGVGRVVERAEQGTEVEGGGFETVEHAGEVNRCRTPAATTRHL
jgi:hypothetical protein